MNKWIYTGEATVFYEYRHFANFVSDLPGAEIVVCMRGAEKEYLHVTHVDTVSVSYQRMHVVGGDLVANVSLVGSESAVLGLEATILSGARRFADQKALNQQADRMQIQERLSAR